VIFSEDTTERSQAEALRSSEAELREAQRLGGMGSWYWNLKGDTVAFSEQLCRILGLTRIVGAIPMQQIEQAFPEIPPQFLDSVRKFAATGEPSELEIECPRPDHTKASVFLHSEAARDEAGNLVGVRGVAQDITARKHAEEQLRLSEARYRSLVETTSDLVWIGKMIGEDIEVPVWLELTGQSAEEAREQWTDAIHPDDRARVVAAWSRFLKEGGYYEAEFRLRGRQGPYRWFSSRAVPVGAKDGPIRERIGTITDITRRKEAEESLRRQGEQLRALTTRLQQVREEERTLVARELHDQIGQILTAVKMDVDWFARRLSLQNESEVSNRVAASLDRIRDATQSLRNICTRLRPGVLDDLGLSAAIEWQLKEFSSLTGIQSYVCIPQEDFPLDAERTTAIFRILQEALTNVTRHAQATMVRASLAQQDGKVVLVVQDDGRGISEAELDAPRTSLGLLGMKERAEACGGELQIWGDPGKGTTVAVQIPLLESGRSGGKVADPASR
jgi:PAS domain S-box-containing protein